MYLYNLTIQRATGIVQAVYGNFSGPKAQEIIVSRGKVLELLRPDENGKVQSILSVEVFGQVRSILPFRLTGGTKDYLLVGSDSGRIVILEYIPTKNIFQKVHQETFGKSGCRRIVPGQFLATDPRGRAAMIAAIEKQKFVYILNRDSAARLTISSPLESHRAHTVIFHMVGLDVGFENPIFAVLEMDYEDEEVEEGVQKYLTYYELDLGLNHMVRKWSDPVHAKANMLITVPGGTDGPGGVLVCTEDFITYKNQNHQDITVKIPRRNTTDPNRGVLIISSATHKLKDIFFFLLQSEYGDLYKVTLNFREETVHEIRIKYFDTLPVCISLALMKTGFLFAAAEVGNHALYQIQSLGDDSDDPEVSSSMDLDQFTFFNPRPLRNLALIDEVNSLCPVLDFKVADLTNEETPQLYALCGRGPRSSLRVLRHGLSVSEMAVSPLPGNPSAVWTVRTSTKEAHDRYIVVSFVNATLVLSIGETVEESTDSGMLSSSPTLLVANIGEDGIIQIHPNGIRHIKADKRIHEWKTPGKKTIVHAASNERQVVVALNGGDILYFELDMMGQLMEVEKKFMGKEVACVAIAPIAEGRQRARFLAVGDWDNTVRIFSLEAEDCLQSLSVQALPTHPESLAIIQMQGYGQENAGTLYLNIGLNNGVLLRSVLDNITGELTDTRSRFLGARPVKLFKIKIRGTNALLALSSRSWLAYNYQARFQMAPLSYVPLEYASLFASEQCPEGIVSISSNTLRIISVERLGELFNQTEIPLTLTPRRFIIHPATGQLVVIESDNNAVFPSSKAEGDEDMDIEKDNNSVLEDTKALGGPKPGDGTWASCVRLLDVNEGRTLDLLQLTNNEAAFSICTCVFHDKGGEVFVCVGTGKDVRFNPKSHNGGFIHIYRLVEGRQFQLVHKTPVESPPHALCPFQGRLLVGVGNSLRIYDMGKKKLLRKCESKSFPNQIIGISTQGDRIYVSDVQDGVFFVKYKKSDNKIYIFADQPTPKWVTSFVMLDYDTTAVADKFGNLMISRLPSQTSDEIEEDPTGSALRVEGGYLNGAGHKLEDVSNYHVGDTITSLARTSLVPGGSEALYYTTMMGSLGAFLPFLTREDVDFFTHLEMHMRQEYSPLCGREHISYRSSFVPVKSCIDGDLCEQFALLEYAKQKQIAEELDRTPMEVIKKLEDIRNRLL